MAVIHSQGETLPRHIGPYRILDRIGTGAYGEVYRALDERIPGSPQKVAVKRLRLDWTDEEHPVQERLLRFHRECAILARIDHPNVVRMIDACEFPFPYLVTEFLPGGDLARAMGKGRPFEPEEALRIARGILRGLIALHDSGVVHRDVKPANILLRREWDPVIADLGTARFLDTTALTVRSTVLGTLGYMAPEQLEGEPVDGRADIYALGGILFQMIAGRLPFTAETPFDAIRQICDEEPVSLSTLRPGLPGTVVRWVDRCLEKRPQQRFHSARAALGALEAQAA